MVRLTVLALTGAPLAEVEAAPQELVKEVKLKLERSSKTPQHFQDLLYGSEILRDFATLQSSGITADAQLTFVRKPVGDYPLHNLMRHIVDPSGDNSILVKYNWKLQNLWDRTKEGDLGTLLDFLLDCKVDPNVRDWSNLTPLQLAAREGRADIVQTLLARPAFLSDRRQLARALHLSLNSLNVWQSGPEHMAVCIALAKEPAMDVNFTDCDGDTALMIALTKSAREVWEAILDRDDVDVGIQNRKGETAFHVAAASQFAAVCQRLLAKPGGEKAEALKDKRNRTAKDVALRSNFMDVHEVVQSTGTEQEPATLPKAAEDLLNAERQALETHPQGPPPVKWTSDSDNSTQKLYEKIASAQMHACAARGMQWNGLQCHYLV